MGEPQSIQFASFRLDLGAEQLWCGTEVRPLTRKAFAILRYLITHAGRLVSKDALIAAVWETPYVSDAALAACIRELRRALDDTAQTPQCLETVRGRGYRFLAPVVPVPAVAPLAHAVVSPALPLPLPPSLPLPPLVGREHEIAQLQQCWTQAQQGVRQIVFVTGEAGIGKTMLVEAFVAQVQAAATVWIGHGQCLEQHGAGEPYLPLLEALGRLGRGPDSRQLVTLLQQQAPSWLLHLPALMSTEDYEALQRRTGEVTREQMLRELAEAVEVLTSVQPVVFILEDLHWSDGATVDWLAYVARRREAARLLVLGTYRPQEAIVSGHPIHKAVQELQLHGQGRELGLPYFSETAVTAYLTERLGAAPSVSLARALHQRTTGNPLFLATVVDTLARQGQLWENGASSADAQALEVSMAAVPDSLRQLIEQQLTRLSPDVQMLLEAASVVGKEFAVATVAEAVMQDVDIVEEHCTALARQGQFVRRGEMEVWPDGTVSERFRFLHDLYRETLYARVPVSRQVRWHRQVGHRLEVGYGPQARDMAVELAEHFVRGRDIPRAVQYLHSAGEQAIQRSAYPEAVTHLARGIALLTQAPETPERVQQELKMQMALGAACIVTKGFGHLEVEQAYARAQALCQQLGDTPTLFPVLSGLWRYANGHGQPQHAWALGNHLMHIAEHSGDAGLVLQAHHALWTTTYNAGAFPTTRWHAEQGIALYRPAQHHVQTAHYGGHDPGVCGYSYAAKSLWHMGYFDQAEHWNEAALALAQELGHPFTLGHTLQVAAGVHQRQRDVQRTYERAAEALRMGTAQGARYLAAISTVKLGWAVAMQGHIDEGIAQIREGLRVWQGTGSRHVQTEILLLLASAYRQAGRYEEGLAAVAEALAVVETTGRRLPEAELYGLKGELLWQACQQLEAAEACFQYQRRLAQQQQAKAWELRAAMGLSRLWQRQGKRAAAYELLAAIYDWFTEGFDTADLQEARALLETLRGA